MGVLSYSPLTGGWLSGRWRKDAGQQSSSRASRLPERFDLSQPANQRKLDAVEELAQLAEQTGHHAHRARDRIRAQPPRHHRGDHRPTHHGAAREPAAAADVVLDDAVLDRIDEIVPPGATVNPVDNSFNNPALEPTTRRR